MMNRDEFELPISAESVAKALPAKRTALICVNCKTIMSPDNALDMEVTPGVRAEHIHSVARTGVERWSVVCANCGHYTITSPG
jgi:hypothetical protein